MPVWVKIWHLRMKKLPLSCKKLALSAYYLKIFPIQIPGTLFPVHLPPACANQLLNLIGKPGRRQKADNHFKNQKSIQSWLKK
jgi:hypothetical protein